jgi:alpha-L-rhamnosidase
LAGIKTVNAGFKEIVMIPPIIEDLDKVDASYQIPYGLVKSSWTRDKEHFNWHITIPPNSKALVYIPVNLTGGITEGGQKATAVKDIKLIKTEGGRAIFQVGSGSYDFEVEN